LAISTIKRRPSDFCFVAFQHKKRAKGSQQQANSLQPEATPSFAWLPQKTPQHTVNLT